MTLIEALEKYIAWSQFQNKASSAATYERDLKHLVMYFHNCELEAVTMDGILEYLNLMKELKYDLRSFIHKCSSFKQFFLFYKKQGHKVIDPELIPIPTFEPKFPKILEEKEYKKLLDALGTRRDVRTYRNHACLRVLWDTGVRIGEFRSMRVEDLDLKEMRTVIKTEKSRGVRPMRMIFWTKETNEHLKRYLEVRKNYLKSVDLEDDGYLWISAYGRWQNGVWSEPAIEQMLKCLSTKAKIGFTCNPHRFRHAYGRNLALQGANNSVISDMMGHSNINSTRIYTVQNESMMQETYKKYFKKR